MASACKATYSAFFDALVGKINTVLGPARDESSLTWIGVLDTFGFESFQEAPGPRDGLVVTHNRFEQLCINAANELLQCFYYNCLIPRQMAIYAAQVRACECLCAVCVCACERV